jgi:hypothetical protein
MTPEEIAARWPRLFHMAEAGTWPTIREHGLLSTTALLDLFEVSEPARSQIEARRRRESVTLEHPLHGVATIRDNKPINETVLRRTLVGMDESEWYRTLNGRDFFWLSEERLNRLRSAPAYRGRPHDVLVLDTARLLDTYADRVELAPINTGAVHAGAKNARGAGTFLKIDEYPWDRRPTGELAVELTVPHSVPDVAEYVVEVKTATRCAAGRP